MHIPCGDDENLQDFSGATIAALDVLRLRMDMLMLTPNWESLVSDVFSICEAAHGVIDTINAHSRARTNAPPPKVGATRAQRPRVPVPSLSTLEELF